MIDLTEQTKTLSEFKDELKFLGESLDVAALEKRAAELTAEQHKEGFWEDVSHAQEVGKELKATETKLENYKKLCAKVDDAEVLAEIIVEADDDAEVASLNDEIAALTVDIEKLRLETLLKGKYDASDAILSLHAGAGGTEAQDWVSMLYRMYTRYAERNGFKVKVMDMLPGDEAGIKSVTFAVEGTNAYGYLKAEKGVHRLVRISPFDANSRRHTSFASLEVMPEIENDDEIKISPDELKVDTYHSSGAGGQHVNKTESAIRITHLPTGIVVVCEDERSQIKNYEKAMKILKTRLYDHFQTMATKAITDKRSAQIGTGDRSERIRTYNFPQGRVSDHRIGLTLYSLGTFMDGDLDEMIEALQIANQNAQLTSIDE